jgi:cytochrome c oxidase subunit III
MSTHPAHTPQKRALMSITTFPPAPGQAPPLPPQGSAIKVAGTKPGPPSTSPSGIWVGIFAITMGFAAFTSALFVRQGTGDWIHVVVPPLLYANTGVLLISSLTLEMSRRAFANANEMKVSALGNSLLWLGITLVFGLAFVVGQYLVWKELAAQGLYLATNSNSSFLYVFTGAHALHVLGGIAGLVRLTVRMTRKQITLRRSSVANTAIYWHFMGALWLYLLLVISVRL